MEGGKGKVSFKDRKKESKSEGGRQKIEFQRHEDKRVRAKG